jgi:hypothetical protein
LREATSIAGRLASEDWVEMATANTGTCLPQRCRW